MKRVLLFIAIAALAGCGGGHSNSSPGDGGGTTTPPPPTSTAFTAFVKMVIANTSDTAQPADVNDVIFTFGDDTNPGAFDSIVGSGG